MIQRKFFTIQEFIGIKDKCVFCEAALKVNLTNFIKAPAGIPILKAKIENDKFSFNIKHTSETYQIDADATINITNNVLQFQLLSWPSYEQYALDYMVAKTAFDNMKPHIELYCPNKKCKMKYHLCSDIFSIDGGGSFGLFSIKPFMLYMESFVFDKLWVQNDWITRAMNIYTISNTDAKPIKTSLIDLESMSKDKLLTRIKTLVTFS